MIYTILPFLARTLGVWAFDLIAKGIAAGYFFFAVRRVTVSVRFYRALYPRRGHAYHWWCACRQFQNFTSVYLDRYLFHESGDIRCTSQGWEHLENALQRQTGAVILMSHLGNWEIAAHLMKRKKEQLPILLFMGLRATAQIEGLQKEGLRRRGIRILAAEKNGATSFDLLEGLRFLQAGGLVSMTGDQLWNRGQRAVTVSMLGHAVRVPEAPYLLAMLSGAPLLVFSSRRTGRGRYHLTLSEPIYIEKTSRRLRTEAIRASAQRYAELLERHLRANPFEWYHFEPFLGPRLQEEPEGSSSTHFV